MASATLASSGAAATFGKDGGGQDRKLSAAVEAAGPGGESRGDVADASATHPPGAGATLTIPLILFLAASAWGLRLIRREPDDVAGRPEWPPIESPDRPPARGRE
jgi:hypothetical protein